MLYRTYRPTTWEQVVGQQHIVQTLQGALALKRTSHAYLFAGPRGTGKTTLARIFAKALNCTASTGRPCSTCPSCVSIQDGVSMDLIEIDAASNRSIDDMRTLKETIGVAPSASTYKVYLIDEAHMITKEASNAFLKMLEEPPAHVVFILATTEAHKMLPTILSRVQRFDFKKLTQYEIAQKLRTIASAEHIAIDEDALGALAGASDGALRDAEVMLTKLATHGVSRIDIQLAQSVLGLVPTTWHETFLRHLIAQDQSAAIAFVQQAHQQGADMDQFLKGFLEYTRHIMIAKIDASLVAHTSVVLTDAQSATMSSLAATMDGKYLVRIIETMTQARMRLRSSPIATLPIELAIISLIQPV